MSSCARALSCWPAMPPLDMSWPPQVECHWIFERAFFVRQIEEPWRVAVILEARQAPRLGFVRVDRKGLVVASAGMSHVIDAAAERASVPAIENIEGERSVDVDSRMQRRRQLPCL